MQPRRPQPQRRTAELDHHVPDLTARAAADPGLAVEDHPAADAGSPEHSQERSVLAPGTEVKLRLGGNPHVVSDRDLGAESLGQLGAERVGVLPLGNDVDGLLHRSRLRVDRAGRSHPRACQRRRLHTGRLGGLAQGGCHRGDHAGRPAVLGCGVAGLADHSVADRRSRPSGSWSRQGQFHRANSRGNITASTSSPFVLQTAPIADRCSVHTYGE